MRVNYAEYIRSEAWQIRRKWKLEQADFKCQVCNSGGELHVHHRTYARLGSERENDLTVLCKKCHEKFHDRLPAKPDAPAAALRSDPGTSVRVERNIVLLLLHHWELAEKITTAISVDELIDHAYRDVLAAAVVALRKRPPAGTVRDGDLAWLDDLNVQAQEAAALILADEEGRHIATPERFLREVVRDLQTRNARRRLSELEVALKASTDEEEQARLIGEMMACRREFEAGGIVLKVNPNPR